MDMAAQVWTLIGVIIAGGTAAFVAILSGTRALGARVDSLGTELRGEISGLRAELKDEIGGLRADIGRLDLRIDGLSHDLGTVNRTLGELVAKSHVHEHAA